MDFDTINHLQLDDGAILPFRLSNSPQPVGVVQICHGMSEHSGRYRHFAQRLSRNGFHVLAHDHRGHGENIGRHAALGQFARHGGDQRVLADVAALNRHARQNYPDLPIILFGHSMGGIIALAYALTFPNSINALAVWNAQTGSRLQANSALALLAVERMLKGSDVPSRLLEQLTFRQWSRSIPDCTTDHDWLSHDAASVAAYRADPKCGFSPTIGLWIDVFRLLKYCAGNASFRTLDRSLPISIAGGGEDPSTDYGKATSNLAMRLRALGFTHVSSTIFPGTRHESLNEINQNEVMQYFQNWLRDIVHSLNSDQ